MDKLVELDDITGFTDNDNALYPSLRWQSLLALNWRQLDFAQRYELVDYPLE